MVKNNNNLELWVTETHDNSMRLGFRVEKTLFTGKSPYQKVDVVETAAHGVMLLNDGLIMLSQRDEFIYHEMIAHVPLFVHPAPRKVLVIGGGDGGSAREILKHENVKEVVMVEIDEMVVDASKKFLPEVSFALDDPRLNILIEDGVKFAEKTKEKFDVVIVDSTDPVGPATSLFGKSFYENISRILNPGGILISQAESPFYGSKIQRMMLENQRPFFKRLHIYLFSNLTYPGGLWSFGFASKELCPVRDFNPEKVKKANINMRYYNPEIHIAAFALPGFVSENLKDIIDNPNLFFV